MRINRVRNWEPWLGNFANLQREISQVFGLETSGQKAAPQKQPPLRIVEEGDSLLLEAVVPGYTLEEIEVTIHDSNKVTLRGNPKEAPGDAKAVWVRKERNHEKFSRTLQVDFPIDSTRVKAKLDNGILKLTLPKHESAIARKIPIQA